jgi:hypothetical protein
MHGMMLRLLLRLQMNILSHLFSLIYLLLIFQRDRERERDSCSIMFVCNTEADHAAAETKCTFWRASYNETTHTASNNNQDDVIF